ncbi:MAG: hypothetical protein ABIG31_01915 [Candidatus Omnitrophota bacterium]
MQKMKLLLFFLIFFVVFPAFLFAQETLTITTYYPSPYGSYNQLYVADRVGIGTTAPPEKLSVYSNNSASLLKLHGAGDAWNFSGIALTSEEAAGNKSWDILHRKVAGELNNFIIQEFDNVYTTRLTIKPGGNVGIGTENPQWKLEVDGFAGVANQLNITGPGGWAQVQSADVDVDLELKTVSGTGAIKFSPNDNEVMTITSTGRVGIGTAVPNTKLAVSGLTSNNLSRRIRMSASGNFYYYSAAFTEYHSYLSDNPDVLGIGDAVCLVNGKLVKSSSKRQTNCVGIVAFKGIGRGNTDSLSGAPESKNLIQVASIGDNREQKNDVSLKGRKVLRGFKVCNEGGAIKTGDLLCTSSKSGFLMKQDDDIMHSYTVGKSLVDVSFDKNGEAKDVYGYLLCN